MRGVFQSNVFQHDVFQISFWLPALQHDLVVSLATRLGAEGLIVVRDTATGSLILRPRMVGALEVRPDETGIGLIVVRDKPSGEVSVL